MRWSLRTAALLVSLGLFVPCAAACSRTPEAHFYTAPATFPSGLHVRLHEAKTSNDRLYVKMWFMNTTSEPIQVDRDGMSLRLRSGEVLPRSVGVTTRHNIYTILPGQGHDVFIDFRWERDPAGLDGAEVILGGVSFGKDPAPRMAGTLPLSRDPAQAIPPPAPEPAPPPPVE